MLLLVWSIHEQRKDLANSTKQIALQRQELAGQREELKLQRQELEATRLYRSEPMVVALMVTSNAGLDDWSVYVENPTDWPAVSVRMWAFFSVRNAKGHLMYFVREGYVRPHSNRGPTNMELALPLTVTDEEAAQLKASDLCAVVFAWENLGGGTFASARVLRRATDFWDHPIGFQTRSGPEALLRDDGDALLMAQRSGFQIGVVEFE